jgi:hypothetical protein
MQGIHAVCKYTINWRTYLIEVNVSIKIIQFPVQILILCMYPLQVFIIFIQGTSIVFKYTNT